jgi:hypothetical protein
MPPTPMTPKRTGSKMYSPVPIQIINIVTLIKKAGLGKTLYPYPTATAIKKNGFPEEIFN